MLVDSMSHILEVPDSTQQPRIKTLGALKREVARVLHAQNDPDVREDAGAAIRWAISYANVTHHFRFGSRQTAVVSLVEDENQIVLPSDFFGVRQVDVLYTDANPLYPHDLPATGDLEGNDPVAGQLPYEPYSTWGRNNPDERSDEPLAWTARNTFSDGYLLVRGRPSDDAAAHWALQIWYDTQIELPDSDTDVISAPKDFVTVVVEGAKYYLLFHRKREDSFGYRTQYQVFERMIERYVAHERRRHGKAHGAWKIGESS